MDSCCLARLYLNSAAQQRGQHLGTHLAVPTPAIPARRVIVFRIPGAEFHKPSGRESVPDPPLGIRQIFRNDHAQHHAPPDGQRQPFAVRRYAVANLPKRAGGRLRSTTTPGKRRTSKFRH